MHASCDLRELAAMLSPPPYGRVPCYCSSAAPVTCESSPRDASRAASRAQLNITTTGRRVRIRTNQVLVFLHVPVRVHGGSCCVLSLPYFELSLISQCLYASESAQRIKRSAHLLPYRSSPRKGRRENHQPGHSSLYWQVLSAQVLTLWRIAMRHGRLA